jgi:hypothetical protein
VAGVSVGSTIGEATADVGDVVAVSLAVGVGDGELPNWTSGLICGRPVLPSTPCVGASGPSLPGPAAGNRRQPPAATTATADNATTPPAATATPRRVLRTGAAALSGGKPARSRSTAVSMSKAAMRTWQSGQSDAWSARSRGRSSDAPPISQPSIRECGS